MAPPFELVAAPAQRDEQTPGILREDDLRPTAVYAILAPFGVPHAWLGQKAMKVATAGYAKSGDLPRIID